MEQNKKLTKINLTLGEWFDALKVPVPYRNRRKYYKKIKHKNKI
jgi:hypothetical protein